MANAVSAMGRLGHVPSQRWLSCFVAASIPLLNSAHPMHLAQAMSGLATLELPPGQAWMDAALARALQLARQAASATGALAAGCEQPASPAGTGSYQASTPDMNSSSSSSSTGSIDDVPCRNPAFVPPTTTTTATSQPSGSKRASGGVKPPPHTRLTAGGAALILWASARLHACSREGWGPLVSPLSAAAARSYGSPHSSNRAPSPPLSSSLSSARPTSQAPHTGAHLTHQGSIPSKPLTHPISEATLAAVTAPAAPIDPSSPPNLVPSPVAVPLPWLASFLAASSAARLLDGTQAQPQHASMVLWALGSLAMHGVAPHNTPQSPPASVSAPSLSPSDWSPPPPPLHSHFPAHKPVFSASTAPQQQQSQTLYPPNEGPEEAGAAASFNALTQQWPLQQHQHQHQQLVLQGEQWNRGVDAALECAAHWGPALGPQGLANSLWAAARLHQHQQQQQPQQQERQLHLEGWPPDALQASVYQQQQPQQLLQGCRTGAR